MSQFKTIHWISIRHSKIWPRMIKRINWIKKSVCSLIFNGAVKVHTWPPKWVWHVCAGVGDGAFEYGLTKAHLLWWLAQSCPCLQGVCTGHCPAGSGHSPASLARGSQTRTSQARSRTWRSRTGTCTAVWARPSRPDTRVRKGSRGTFWCRGDTASARAGSKTKLAAELHSWFRVRAGSGGASPCTLCRGTGGGLQGLACSCSSCRITRVGRNCIIRGWLPCRASLWATTVPPWRRGLSFCLRVKAAEIWTRELDQGLLSISQRGRSFCQWPAPTVPRGFSSRHVWVESGRCA